MAYPHQWSPISCRSSAGQGKFAGQRPTFYHCCQEIDTYLDRATEQGYSAFLTLGARLVSFLTSVVLTGAARGQTTLAEHLSRTAAAALQVRNVDVFNRKLRDNALNSNETYRVGQKKVGPQTYGRSSVNS